MIRKSFQFRLYPNEQQQKQIHVHFNQARFVYNYYLGKRLDLYNETKENFSYFKCTMDLTQLKKTEEFKWLNESDIYALNAAIKDADTAIMKFKKGINRYPKFKTKKKSKQSYRTRKRNGEAIINNNKAIVLPKIGPVKAKSYFKRLPENIVIKNITVTLTNTGKYIASLECEVPDREIKQRFNKTNKAIGIDLGIKTLATCSNGTKYENPRYFAQEIKRLGRLSRTVMRKPSESHNRQKALLRLNKVYERVKNRRRDYLQKLSTSIIKENDIICMETIKVMDLVLDKIKNITSKAKKINSSLYDTSLFTFTEFLKYKSDWYDRSFIKVSDSFPSTQTCHICGYVEHSLSQNLNKRSWQCPVCNTQHDRDINAAINILNEGVRISTLKSENAV